MESSFAQLSSAMKPELALNIAYPYASLNIYTLHKAIACMQASLNRNFLLLGKGSPEQAWGPKTKYLGNKKRQPAYSDVSTELSQMFMTNETVWAQNWYFSDEKTFFSMNLSSLPLNLCKF